MEKNPAQVLWEEIIPVKQEFFLLFKNRTKGGVMSFRRIM